MISRRGFLKLGTGIIATSFLHQHVFAQDPSWVITGDDSPNLSSFDDTMFDFMSQRNIRGGALAVTDQGKLVLARGYAFNTDEIVEPTSLFRIYSLSKAITATVILKLIDEGQLSFDSHVTDILNLEPRDPRMNDVTILHLLQHLGGWDRDQSFDPMLVRDRQIADALGVPLPISTTDIINFMADQPLDFDPGTRYAYSNFGYCLLGRVIETITGQSYADATQQAVFEPLNMNNMALASTFDRLPAEVSPYTQYNQPVPSAFDADSTATWLTGGINFANIDSHGGWLGSAVDMARFITSFDDPNTSLVSPDVVFAEPSIGLNPDGYYYGCGWLVRPVGNGLMNTWHIGALEGGFSIMVRRWDGRNWVALFNQRDDPSGLSYDTIDPMLHDAANAVTAWPDIDLFQHF